MEAAVNVATAIKLLLLLQSAHSEEAKDFLFPVFPTEFSPSRGRVAFCWLFTRQNTWSSGNILPNCTLTPPTPQPGDRQPLFALNLQLTIGHCPLLTLNINPPFLSPSSIHPWISLQYAYIEKQQIWSWILRIVEWELQNRIHQFPPIWRPQNFWPWFPKLFLYAGWPSSSRPCRRLNVIIASLQSHTTHSVSQPGLRN